MFSEGISFKGIYYQAVQPYIYKHSRVLHLLGRNLLLMPGCSQIRHKPRGKHEDARRATWHTNCRQMLTI